MFSKMGIRVIAAAVVMMLLGGCAEFDRRGGVVADVEDVVLFKAYTKSHRLFRSYMLAGVLVAAARQGGHNDADKAAIGGNLRAVLSVAFEAYQCLYIEKNTVPGWVGDAIANIGTFQAVSFDPPKICQFFDEKMARLDYALFRLALSALFNEKSNSQLANIRDKLVGEIPVISASAKAAIFANRALNQTTSIVDDLLNLSFSSAGPVLTLLPLYRDSLEMNMWVVVDSLTRACATPEAELEQVKYVSFTDAPAEFGLNCPTRDYALSILNQGNGDLIAWRDFIRRMNYVGSNIDAYAPHFALVTRLIWRSCRNLLKEGDCQTIFTDTVKLAVQESFEVGVKERKRPYSASIRAPSQFARERYPQPSAPSEPPAVVVSPSRDPATTGSIPRPSGTTGQAPTR